MFSNSAKTVPTYYREVNSDSDESLMFYELDDIEIQTQLENVALGAAVAKHERVELPRSPSPEIDSITAGSVIGKSDNTKLTIIFQGNNC